MQRCRYKVEKVQGEQEDDDEAVGGYIGVNGEDKGGKVCVVVILVTSHVKDAQGEYADEG